MSGIALGIHIGHDRGAALVKDGSVLAAISQERLDRVKHSRSYHIPYQSIDTLLSYTGLEIRDIGCVGFSGDAMESSSVADFLRNDFREHYCCPNLPFLPVSHHDSHAYSTYYTSGLQKSLILVADGGGDYIHDLTEAESLYLGSDGRIILLEARRQSPTIRKMSEYINYLYPYMPQTIRRHEISIARKYEQITYMLGFGWGEAGKTMGLASYGTSLLDFADVAPSNLHFSLQYDEILSILYAMQQNSGQNHFAFIDNRRADIARTVQEYTEKSIVSIVTGVMKKYHVENICLAGGLFLNCMLNHLILEQCPVKEAFFFPAAGDDGQAIGNAFFAYCHHFGDVISRTLDTPYLGVSYSDTQVESVLRSHSLSYRIYDDDALADALAQEIFENKIVALHHGRTEIGPRALCHRSILANPTNSEMKDILNSRVKHREEFRPFAPVVTAERQFEIFELKQVSPYMLLAPHVREEYRRLLPAITHVDGTARVQAVTKQERFVHDILTAFEKRTGLPVLLNTSFNVAGEPIVESPEDAVQTFLKTQIDTLCIGHYLVTK